MLGEGSTSLVCYFSAQLHHLVAKLGSSSGGGMQELVHNKAFDDRHNNAE